MWFVANRLLLRRYESNWVVDGAPGPLLDIAASCAYIHHGAAMVRRTIIRKSSWRSTHDPFHLQHCRYRRPCRRTYARTATGISAPAWYLRFPVMLRNRWSQDPRGDRGLRVAIPFAIQPMSSLTAFEASERCSGVSQSRSCPPAAVSVAPTTSITGSPFVA